MASWDDDLDLEQALAEEQELTGELLGSSARWSCASYETTCLRADSLVGDKRQAEAAPKEGGQLLQWLACACQQGMASVPH